MKTHRPIAAALVLFLAVWQIDLLREAVLTPPPGALAAQRPEEAPPSGQSDDFWDAYASVVGAEPEALLHRRPERLRLSSASVRFAPGLVRISHVPIA